VNGASGIAVGMATNIPPHNLREVIEAAVLLLEKPDTSLRDILKLVPGPDFPTGGYIAGREGIEAAYNRAVAASPCAPKPQSKTQEKTAKISWSPKFRIR